VNSLLPLVTELLVFPAGRDLGQIVNVRDPDHGVANAGMERAASDLVRLIGCENGQTRRA
jgi:hypothetical protein